jgi:dihydroorotase-like cyclic amidohydrolase
MALQKFPGLIDIHVHLREPGATQKEDFRTGTRAAVKGGFTFVCDMPNNYDHPTITRERSEEKIKLSSVKAICDVGFHYGTDGNNLESFPAAIHNAYVYGLKIYCGKTTGNLSVNDPSVIEQIFRAWESSKPILLHAEGELLRLGLVLGEKYSRWVHVCHISQLSDMEIIRKAKESYQELSCGVTPHHLFITNEIAKQLGAYAFVKPPIGNEENRLALWEGLKKGIIDLVESDHAPHTKNEKLSGAHMFGVPGLETTLGLFCRSVHENKLTMNDIVRLLYDTPKKIFNIPDQPDTFVELDPSNPFVVGAVGYETKCGWSPFDGWELFGKVETVVLRNKPLVVRGNVL